MFSPVKGETCTQWSYCARSSAGHGSVVETKQRCAATVDTFKNSTDL